MPDEQGEKKIKKEDLPKTSLHAYMEGRSEDVEGDPTGQDVVKTPVEERDNPDKH
jgi:hypothetical protein